MSLEEDCLFDIISKAIMFHLSASDAARGQNSVRLRHTIAAADILVEPTVRMLAIARPHRFPTYLIAALLLACHTEENCKLFKYIFAPTTLIRQLKQKGKLKLEADIVK